MPRAVNYGAVVGAGISVRPSTLGVLAGQGLFADQAFARRSFITFYDGPRISRTEALHRRTQGLASHIISCGYASGECIDGLTLPTPGCGGGSFINDAGHSGQRNNAQFIVRDDGQVWIRARYDIKIGEEIFASYGCSYWQYNHEHST